MRVGYAAKGVVYLTVGVLAARAAAGWGRVPDTGGALRTVERQPLGDTATTVVGLGLVAYAAWRVVQALLDVDHKGDDLKGLATRAGFLGSGLGYLGLAATALGLTASSRSSSATARLWTGHALADPAGPWLVGAVGLGVLAAAAWQFYKAYSLRFEKRLRTESMSASGRLWLRRVGRLGLVARGVTFGIIGWFLLRAAFYFNPREARGLDGALRVVRQQDYGPWLLGLVGVGLAAYGVFALLTARYRQVG
jgi:hypothetical protein